MQELGFDRFSVAGHDRGGRVASRLPSTIRSKSGGWPFSM